MKKSVIVVLTSVALSTLAAFGVVKAACPAGNALSVSGSDSTFCAGPVNLSVSDYPDFTFAAENAVKAVVFVKVTIKQSQPQVVDPFFFFFGDPGNGGNRDRLAQGSGSGVIISPDGYIVTNNHVVDGAVDIEVSLDDNKSYKATVIGTDPATDVALIKIDAQNLPTISFADSDKLRLGEWVLAIGSPLELRSTITEGIVSAKGRSMPNYDGKFKVESFIQTDAAVNPGNSGGALVNKAGQLVGINTAIISQTGSYSGYSFAIPSNIVSKIVSDLIDFGSVQRVRLGVTISPVTQKIADEMKLSSLDGVYINEVSKGGAADVAGIKVGDVVLKVDSTVVRTPSDLQVKINSLHPGDVVEMSVIRSGKPVTVSVTFTGEQAQNGQVASDGSVLFYGALLKQADAEKLAALGLRNGVEIVSAGNGTMAQAGAADGQVIVYVNDVPVKTPDDVVSVAKKSKRAVYIQGVSENRRTVYFGFGKE